MASARSLGSPQIPSPVMLPIPGTSQVKHLEENVAGAAVALSDDEFAALDQAGKTAG